MNTLTILCSAAAALIGALGGGGIFFIRENKRDKRLDIELKEADAWRELYNEQKRRGDEKSERLRERYAYEDGLKSQLVEKDKVIAQKDMQIERLEWYRCINNNCDKRNPKRRFDLDGNGCDNCTKTETK